MKFSMEVDFSGTDVVKRDLERDVMAALLREVSYIVAEK